MKKHKKSYDDDDDEADENSLGPAAAMQALKLFNQGETGGKQSQGAFVGLALSEASKVGHPILPVGRTRQTLIVRSSSMKRLPRERSRLVRARSLRSRRLARWP